MKLSISVYSNNCSLKALGFWNTVEGFLLPLGNCYLPIILILITCIAYSLVSYSRSLISSAYKYFLYFILMFRITVGFDQHKLNSFRMKIKSVLKIISESCHWEFSYRVCAIIFFVVIIPLLFNLINALLS